MLGLLVAVGILVAACGDADNAGGAEAGDDGSTSVQPDSDGDAASDETVTTAPAAEDDGNTGGDDEGSGSSTATVTLGDQTYSFSSEGAIVAQCLTDLFGIFSVQLPMIDGDGNIGIVALYPDTDPSVVGEVNAVRVSVGDEDWIADEDDQMFASSDLLEAGMSQVDSVEIDGRTVRGTATFFRQLSLFSGDEVETITGTFEATCGEERTS